VPIRVSCLKNRILCGIRGWNFALRESCLDGEFNHVMLNPTIKVARETDAVMSSFKIFRGVDSGDDPKTCERTTLAVSTMQGVFGFVRAV
jgi:hypothetical protein